LNLRNRKTKKNCTSEQSQKYQRETIQQINIRGGIPRKRRKGKGVQTIFEEMKGEIFPNMMKGTNITTQEVP
jgi:hypothetical protein